MKLQLAFFLLIGAFNLHAPIAKAADGLDLSQLAMQKSIRQGPSAYLRISKDFAIGEEFTFPVLQQIVNAGYSTLVIEIRGYVDSVNSNEIFFGRQYDGAGIDGFRPFIDAAHLKGLKVVFKLAVSTLNELLPVASLQPTQKEDFASSYRNFLRYYAKIAEKLSVDSLVIGTGLSTISCSDPTMVTGFAELAHFFYKGALEIDLSYDELYLKCLQPVIPFIQAVGVDLPLNPNPTQVIALLKDGYQISRLVYSGVERETSARTLFMLLPKNSNVSIGFYYMGPIRVDFDASPLGSPLQTTIEKWLKK